MLVKPAERNKILVHGLGAMLTDNGFVQRRGAQGDPLWSKETGGGFILLQIIGNKRQWEPMQGSFFYVRTAVHADENMASASFDNQKPLSRWLDADRLEHAYQLQQQIVQKILSTAAPSDFDAKMKELYGGMLRAEIQRPFNAKGDIKYRYLDADDLNLWCAFLVECFPVILEKLQSAKSAS